MGIALTKKELASIAGYTYRRLYDIDRDLPNEQKLFVESEGGKYDLAQFVQRWVKYNLDSEASEVDDLDTVKARHEVVKTRKTELEVARMSGQLIDVQDIKRLWGNVADSVKKNFLNLSNKLAPRLVMMESQEAITAMIDEEVRTVLEAVAETPLPDNIADEDSGNEEADEEGEEA